MKDILVVVAPIAFMAAFIIILKLLTKISAPKEACPECGGGGKQFDEAHNSRDLQAVNCRRCDGTGEINSSEESFSPKE